MVTKTNEVASAPARRLAVRVSDAAEMLMISRSKAYDLIRQGKLPAISVGKTVRVPVAALEEWVRGQLARPEAE